MDLLSIAAPAVEVPVDLETTVTVRGISLRAVASLLARFPNLLALFQGRDLDLHMLAAVAPEAAAAIMAAGAGHLDDLAAEKLCASLGLQVQVDMLSKIAELTFPAGFGPFVDKLTAITSSLPPVPQQQGNGAAPDHGTQHMS